MRRIYLDYAATTPQDSQVTKLIDRYSVFFGNSSSPYKTGRKAKAIIDQSKEKIASIVGASASEIVFTGSGTESVNTAILGIARAYKKFGRHIITSSIEHLSVLEACRYLSCNEGFKVTYLDVDKQGLIKPEDVLRAIRPDTVLVSIMYANNEIGSIQPIAKIAKLIQQFRNQKSNLNEKTPFFHSDACQAAGALDLDIRKLSLSAMSLNGSKIYGPKGMGVLYVKKSIRLSPIIIGGSQQRGLRAGTENPALCAGLALALESADKKKDKESNRLRGLRDYLISRISEEIPDTILNGDPVVRLPNNINFSFSGIDGEMLVYHLDLKGIEISTGSACTTSTTDPSHVITALGLESEYAKGNIRVALGRQTTKRELDIFVSVLKKSVKKLRSL